jgi:hypothetical protein
MTDELAPCPCGEIPEKLIVDGPEIYKSLAMVSGYCCGKWHIEFRTYYAPLDSEKILRLAREAWNAAPRGKGGL